ncbi:TPA: helix-turn-helix domain-containing protein [Streptococcus pyogenes]
MILVGGSKQKMTVGNLFTTKQWRELELIALLTKSQKPLYCKDVCEKLDSSLLTLQSCIDNSAFMDGIGQMTYEYSHFSITYKVECGLKEVYQKAMLESQSLQMMLILFFKDVMSLGELANELFVSLSTLKRLIEKVNIYLKNEFDIKIITNPIQVVGEESQIRLFYIKYFSEAYSMSEWLFGNLVNEHNFGRLISLMISKTDVNINFSMFRHIKILGGKFNSLPQRLYCW